MKTFLDLAMKTDIMLSLEEVGRSKAIGYLPFHTIENILGEKIDEIAEKMRARGLIVCKLDGNKTCIKSGALFVFHHLMVKDILEKYNQARVDVKIQLTPHELVLLVARRWYDPADPIMPLIKALYNEK